METKINKTNSRGSNKRQNIIDASVRVFARQGFFQSTISQIAREAGVAGGTIYLYFKNKEDILIQIFDLKTRQVFEKFKEEVDKAGSSLDKLKNLIRRHLEEFQQDREMAILYQAETHRQGRPFEAHIKKMSEMYLDIVSEIVEQGQQEGVIRKDLYVSLVKRFILGGVDEVINTWLHSKKEYDLTSMADPLVDLFINGIGVQTASGKK